MNHENSVTKNPLGTEKIGKLMLQFSIPCIMSLLVSSLYNIVDQIFIGRGVGYLGNGATNVVFPITIIALAFALFIGDGCAAYLSLCQGCGDKKSANKSVGNAFFLLILFGILFTVILFIGRDGFLRTFGVTEANRVYAVEYFSYIVIGIPFFVFGNGANSIIRADGSPKFAMFSTLIGAVINIILDPIAIFVFHMGMKGAALATITGQIVTAALAVFYWMKKANTVKLSLSSFDLRGGIVRKFLPMGISSFLTQVSIVVVMAVMNNTLITAGAASKYGADIPLTVMGIVMKVFQIFISFVVGIAAGCQPIVGYNYGAGHYARVKEILKKMLAAEVVVGLVGMICFEIFPLQITEIFGSESALYNEFAVYSFRIYLATIILCCIQKSASIFLQSLGKPILSTGLSLLRDFILLVPSIILLGWKFGIMGPLFAAPIADAVSVIVTAFVLIKIWRELSQKDGSSYYTKVEKQGIIKNNI
ncbi:MAG: MATE family efflux transporter [Lachnospiraceae bacterium]|nr:MATE family efflux transporter [Lachnospiraceae bacterium]